MITDQPVNNHDDMRKVTDNVLRDTGLTIDDGGGTVTFAGMEPIRKTVMKAGASAAIVVAPANPLGCSEERLGSRNDEQGDP